MARVKCKRSENTLLVKNLPYTTKEKEIRDIFERYGQLNKLSISPSNTIGIVEYKTAAQAKTAAKYLAYYKVNYIQPIYIEFAPEIFDNAVAPDSSDSEEENN